MANAKSSASSSGNGGAGAAPSAAGPQMSGSKRQRIGQVLVGNNVISLDQLDKALANQKESARLLGQTIVQLGYASEPDVLRVINHHYSLSLTSLDQRFQLGQESGLAKLFDRIKHVRISIKAKLSIAIIFSLLVSILILSVVVLNRQSENLYRQTAQMGKVSLSYFANSAKTPLLNNEVLRLNQLIKEATSTEGILYAAIIDRDGIIQAHTDPSLLRKKLEVDKPKEITQEGMFHYFRYTNEKGQQVLNMSTPVAFQDKVLGEVDVGVSLDFISDQIRKEGLAITLLSVLIIALGVVISIFLGIGFSRPISQLVVATRQIGQGNLQYRLELDRNDELGDLANSFNFMSAELWKKQLMQESFGKYVGSDIVQMILANPESSWLKGTRNTATVMFTDIRGFTAYSENREPEEVVEALNDYFEIATRVIIDHGGYVDKFIGDAVMGVFGVPVATENHAEQCVRASLVMQKEFLEAAKRTGNPILPKVGIGINTGPLVSGNLGSQAKMEYTVIGDAVNTASRLNGLAASGETVISKSTLDPIKHLVKVQEMEPQKVKGKAEPVQVYKVLSIKEAAPHAQGKNQPAQRPTA